jgi:uncharacterized protein with GYD domain
MARYLYKVSYSHDGLKGLMEQGAASRVEQIGQIIAGNGGTMKSFDFAFGATDAYVILELPSDTAAAALSLAVAASGVARLETVKLLTPAEVDEARGIQTGYVPPGS